MLSRFHNKKQSFLLLLLLLFLTSLSKCERDHQDKHRDEGDQEKLLQHRLSRWL
jgi:hypothetical protein